MSRFGTILALVALVAAGVLYVQLEERTERVDALESTNVQMRDRLADLETRLAKLGDGTAAPLRGAEASTNGPTADAAGTLTGRAASPLDRIAALEARLAKQDETLERVEAEAEAAKAAASTNNRPAFLGRTHFANLDAAATALELKAGQKRDMQDILDRAKRELADLRAIENDRGETWDSVSKPKMVTGEGFSIAMPDMKKIRAFKDSRIPGSSETFGEAESRIRKDAFARARRLLGPKQAETWDKAHKGGLLNDGASTSIAFVGMSSGD